MKRKTVGLMSSSWSEKTARASFNFKVKEGGETMTDRERNLVATAMIG
jgi:hypothetical protein